MGKNPKPLKGCLHPECSNLFIPNKAQRYCETACRLDDRRCCECGDKIPKNAPGTKNRYCRICDRVKKYGINKKDYLDLLVIQDFECAICRSPHDIEKPLVVDHDHETGVVRGLLCKKCNMALGLLQDHPGAASAAADYLVGLHWRFAETLINQSPIWQITKVGEVPSPNIPEWQTKALSDTL